MLKTTLAICAAFGMALMAAPTGYPLPISGKRTLVDEKAGDGIGGWTDQGPRQDGRHFAALLNQTEYIGIPFRTSAKGKCVLVLKSDSHFPQGPASVELPVAKPEKFRCLYLMHTMAWSGKVGKIIFTDTAGKSQSREVDPSRDIGDWYHGKAMLENAYPAVVAQNAEKNETVLFVSRFPVPANLGPIANVRLVSGNECLWMVVAASLTPEDIPLPAQKQMVIRENDEWQRARLRFDTRVEPGSVLDRTPYSLGKTVDELGRIVIRDGHFWYEKDPKRRAWFQVNAFHPSQLNQFNHAMLEAWVDELARNGYNMIRPHFLDEGLMLEAKAPLEFNEKVWDNFEYLVHLCKQRGIYIMFDAMTSWIGYTPGSIWSQEGRDSLRSIKYRIAVDPAIRENWSKGVEKLLRHQNKYTGTRLAEDPVLAVVISYNEQEFGFYRTFREDLVAPLWREYLKRKYGTIAALNRAWKDQVTYAKFEDVPVWKLMNYSGVKGNDALMFVYERELELLNWYVSELRRFGYPGPVTAYNTAKRLSYSMMRSHSDFVAMNNYGSHPIGQKVNQVSQVGSALRYMRAFAATRHLGKPFVISEHNIVYWCRYRYEQGFGTGAFGAFQDYDAVTVHAEPINLRPGELRSFRIAKDPVLRACEYLTYFLFVRRDVKPARSSVRIRLNEDDIFAPGGFNGGMPADNALASLVSGLAIECVAHDGKSLPPRKNELLLNLDRDAEVVIGNGFTETKDSDTASAASIVAELKRSGFISKNNRSDGKRFFETDTGEIFVDTEKSFMQINTPCFQGFCALAGTQAKLPALQVHQMSLDGNLALVSVDGDQPLRKAKRMTLVYITNALNSGMSFKDEEMSTVDNRGKAPVLVQCGQFEVSVRNENASRLSLYPLDFAGHRLKRMQPVAVDGDTARFAVDMRADGQAFFYELVAE